MFKKLILIFIIVVLILIFINYARSFYMPLLIKIKGKETIESRIKQIEPNAGKRLNDNLVKIGFINEFPKEIIIAAFKKEQILQVYAKDYNEIFLIKEYPFTANSGKLGPKLKEGDKQIPEGVYRVEYLNPNSTYYLSIKVNYPNDFDKQKSKLSNVSQMGGDIFIHGKAVTIGCIPIGDKAIEEVFLLSQKAINNNIKIIISPRDFRKNPKYPNILEINWENELYDLIKEELLVLTK